jgi:hypothetical protein
MSRRFFEKSIFLLLLVFTLSGFNSCTEDEPDTTPATPEYSFMSMTLNGTDYEGLVTTLYPNNPAAWVQESSLDNTKFLLMQGNHPDYQVNLRLPENNWKVGTYQFTEGSFNSSAEAVINLINSNFESDYDLTGTVTITEFDLTKRTLKGTFDFSSPTNTATGTLDYPLDDDEFM